MEQKILDRHINSYAIRCFRDTADKDYIHARLAYKYGLIAQFRWSSLHCLEKYAKCILLLNRIDGKKIKHNISKAINKINESEKKLDIKLSNSSKEFIELLEKHADDRYLDYSWSSYDQGLVDLDFAVWELRRYCKVFSYTMYGKDFTDTNLARIKNINRASSQGQQIIEGWLEKVLRNKNHISRDALVWNNLYFSLSRRNKITCNQIIERQNAPIDLHPEIEDELLKYIYFKNKKVKNDKPS